MTEQRNPKHGAAVERIDEHAFTEQVRAAEKKAEGTKAEGKKAEWTKAEEHQQDGQS
ncbi:hypothetical protein ACIG5E_12870 [Kitasatospora sp. NPDC053057]|uniref:hypothetical protein n=1 Tax=Kitasatospora sp. NPDC053057 TaxID=3364062 RepID=UPI0037C4F9D2